MIFVDLRQPVSQSPHSWSLLTNATINLAMATCCLSPIPLRPTFWLIVWLHRKPFGWRFWQLKFALHDFALIINLRRLTVFGRLNDHVFAVGLKQFSVVDFSLVCGFDRRDGCLGHLIFWLALVLRASVICSGSAFGVAWPHQSLVANCWSGSKVAPSFGGTLVDGFGVHWC